jgi:hypothetical protein
MANINIADFNRPGIFIREIDDSVRQIPAQTTLINLVPGFSRKGPVNRPILITTPQQLFEIFGDIDRFLEKKGSFFHRTILNILNNGPVWALNLLKTDDDLDQLEWKTISVASNVANDIVKKSAYSAFFNKSDFWYRDTESFLNVAHDNVTDNRHIFHITNMSDRKVSVFMFKSKARGYDETLEVWYGGKANVPAYLHPTDLASDYVVSMLIVSGDWSDYKTLSVDTKWSKYFNPNGLRKDQITNFMNDSSVSLLKFYSDLSLIPYFKAEANNVNSRDIFIETVVNRDTDTTGVFVAYDIDAVEGSDYSTGLLDLIGSNLVDEDVEAIEYLSYKESISENLTFTEQILDRAGNAFGHEGVNHEGKLLSSLAFTDFLVTTGVNSSEINLIPTDLEFILSGVQINALNNTVEVNDVAIGKIRKDTLYFDANGNLGVEHGFEVSNQTQWDDVPLKPLASGVLPVAIIYIGSQGSNGSLGITAPIQVLNPIDFEVSNGTNSADILITYGVNNASSNIIEFEFTGTKSSDNDYNYRKTRLLAIFNQLQSKLKVGTSIIKSTSDQKIVLTNITFGTSGSENKTLTIVVSPSLDINTSFTGTPEIFFVDDELTFKSLSGDPAGTKTEPTSSSSGYGVVSSNSTLYKSYRDGFINTGDYFYPNLFFHEFPDVEFRRESGNDIITLYYNDADSIVHGIMSGKIRIFGSEGNDKEFTVLNMTLTDTNLLAEPLYDFGGRTYNLKLDIIVNELVKLESVLNGHITVHGANESDITYLKMYFIGSNLTVQYCDKLLNPVTISSDYNLESIKVFSKKNNFKQSLEIEAVLATNKILINSARYSEVKIGDYIQAFVDEDLLQPGEVGKRLTRIVSKKLFAADPTLVEITTDAQIDILTFGTDMQTFRFTSMESYVNTYNAIVLGGFKMRADSMPDGSEKRQSDILDVLAPGTALFKGLVNRNKITWRYLVDPWGNGLTANSKQQLVDLCGEKLTCFGILNMPSAKAFKNSSSTLFVNSDGTLNTEFIKLGGDPESSPAFLYSFGQGVGQSNVGFFFPYVSIVDNGRPVDMPPSSFVANTFMRKHTTRLASVKPWTVAAGLTNGFLTGFGNVEMDLNPENIEDLNLMNANPIVYKMNRGYCIETDNTAQVSPRSALSYIHVREVLIELEEEMYQMLLTYQWRFNTREVREEIKAKADAICQRYVRDNGLYDFFNVIDESNNTPEIIDAQIGILDTYVEPIKAMGVIVNNITILKTGDIQAGGFR